MDTASATRSRGECRPRQSGSALGRGRVDALAISWSHLSRHNGKVITLHFVTQVDRHPGLIERLVLTPGEIHASLHGDLGTIIRWAGWAAGKEATCTSRGHMLPIRASTWGNRAQDNEKAGEPWGSAGPHSIISRFNAEVADMIVDGTYHRLLHIHWIFADIDGDGLREHVPHDDRAGLLPPERSYLLFAEDSPITEPGSTRRYYFGGNVYDDWSTVPARHKSPDFIRPVEGLRIFTFRFLRERISVSNPLSREIARGRLRPGRRPRLTASPSIRGARQRLPRDSGSYRRLWRLSRRGESCAAPPDGDAGPVRKGLKPTATAPACSRSHRRGKSTSSSGRCAGASPRGGHRASAPRWPLPAARQTPWFGRGTGIH